TPSPPFPSPRNSDQYYGTIGHDPELTSPLPILHRFIQRPPLADRVSGTRGSVFYNNRFYDNVFIRQRGGTATNWPKKNYKIEFNDANHFEFKPSAPPVDEFNLNATYTDKSYLRARLTAEFGLDAGLPSPETFHFRVQQNGGFFSVALFVEQPDRDFLDRNGLDPDGSLYKGGPGSNYTSPSSFEKKTRRHERARDLQILIGSLRRPGETRDHFVYDNINLPAQINFLAVVCLTQNIDASDKNHYLFRDTEGTGEWHMLPWDLDLTFGPDALNTDNIVYRADRDNAAASHPFIGARPHLLHTGKYNLLIESIIAADGPRQMLLRRIRTLTDQFLATGYFENRIDQLVGLLAADVPNDRARWRNNAHFPGRNDPFETAAGFIKSRYLTPRLGYLTETLAAPNPVGMPTSQPPQPPLTIASIESAPASGNRLEQFAELHNPNPYAVDLTGWRIRGSIAHKFKPGTVIPAETSLFLSPHPTSFRTRSTGPSGDQKRFVQGPYAGQLPDAGGLIQVFDPSDELVLEHAYQGDPTDLQQFLRVTELFYNPPGQAEDSEFIELKNTSRDTPLDLSGLTFTSGITFAFPQNTNLAPGGLALLVADTAGFQAAHGNGLPVIGEYTGNLANGGEKIQLDDTTGNPLLFFDYSDNWFELTDGDGFSLVLRDTSAPVYTFGQIDQWAPAPPSPGASTTSFAYDYFAWLAHQFGNRNISNTAPQENTDSDALDNWFEFAFAQDMDAHSRPDVATVTLTEIDGHTLPTLHFTRPSNPVGVDYNYTWSDNAGTPSVFVGGIETITPGTTPNTETV
ncbi:MAG: CotH kinase family protein, partial [Verrucomicrobiales bacterium]|nr:CotH kinase family protein [Verrucomicrobiales bacterium]